MQSSLRTLLAAVFDYAGLFPPARLPLDQAIPNFASYREAPESWMLAHFVMPVARLAELKSLVPKFATPQRPLTFSMLGASGRDAEGWLSGLEADFIAVGNFLAEHPSLVAAPAFEIALPADPSDQLERLLSGAMQILQKLPHGVSPAVFFELTPRDDWAAMLDRLAGGLAARTSSGRVAVGFKLRTGGLVPEAFPTVQQIATFIAVCNRHGVRWKATAGLHHPLRQHRDEVGTKMHGFLNLLVATVLARSAQLGVEQISDLLADETAEHFQFHSDRLVYKEYSASCQEIEAARDRGLVSIGSCSFDEPREDLRELKLL